MAMNPAAQRPEFRSGPSPLLHRSLWSRTLRGDALPVR